MSGSLESEWSSTATVYTTEKVWLGFGSTGQECFLPTNLNWNYYVNQQIYRADELNAGACAITSIDFMNVSDYDRTRNMDIYIVHTDKTTVSDSSDWVTVTENDKVFSGSVTFKAGAWSTINFDTSFIYNGTQNIAVIVADKTGSSPGTTYFRTYSATYGSGMYEGSDSAPLDPTNVSYTGSRLTYKNAVRFGTSMNTHTITVDGAVANGSVTVSRAVAVSGDKIIVTPAPDSGYLTKSVKYNGTAAAPENGVYTFTMPDEDVTVTLCWSDGTNTYAENELPAVTADVTYTAVIKAVKTLEVGTVFTLDDAVIFGEDNYFNNWNYDGRVGLYNGIGTAVFGEPEYNSYLHLYLIVDTKTHISLGVNSPKLNEAFSVKCIAGDGTEQKPFLFRLIPESGENSFKVVCESSGKYVYDIYAASGTAISAPDAPNSPPAATMYSQAGVMKTADCSTSPRPSQRIRSSRRNGSRVRLSRARILSSATTSA